MASLNETAFLKDLLKLNDFSESRWQTYDEELRDYLNFLCRCDLQKLHSEILAVEDDQRRVVREQQELAFTNYKTFIDVADCTHEMLVEFNQLQDSLAVVIQGLPKLSEKSESLLKEIHSLSQARKQNAVTLAKHPQLLELLELSQLMETAVRNSYYDEALELLNYVRRLEKKHARDIPLVRALCADVKRIGQALVAQLIQQLHGAAPLSQSLKIVSLLRRMELLSEAELRLLFLQARTRHVETALSAIQPLRDKDAYTYICRFVETNRVQLFDVVTQYRAIFADDVGSLSTALLGDAAGDGKLASAADLLSDNPIWDELGSAILPSAGGDETARTGLVHLWITQRIGVFFDTLSGMLLDLATFEKLASRLDSLALQCNYFALSLARVACDFRPLVNALFVRAVTNCLNVRLATATRALLEQLAAYSDRDPTPLRSGATLSHFQQNLTKQLEAMSARCEATGYARTLLADASFSTADALPNTSVIHTCEDALLHFANAVITTLNELRPILTLATLFHAQTTVQSALEQVANTIRSYLQTLSARSGDEVATDRRDASVSDFESRWCDGLLCVVVPYLHCTFVSLQPPVSDLLLQFGTKSQSELLDLGVRVGLNATRLYTILTDVSTTAQSRLQAMNTRFDSNDTPQVTNVSVHDDQAAVTIDQTKVIDHDHSTLPTDAVNSEAAEQQPPPVVVQEEQTVVETQQEVTETAWQVDES